MFFKSKEIVSIPCSSTAYLYGYRIEKTLGLVQMVVAPSAGIISDWFARWADIFDARAESYEDKFTAPLALAVQTIKKRVVNLGGNGLVGVHHAAVAPPGDQSVILYSIMGTAVLCRNEETGKLPYIEEVFVEKHVPCTTFQSSSEPATRKGDDLTYCESGPDESSGKAEQASSSKAPYDHSKMGPSSRSRG